MRSGRGRVVVAAACVIAAWAAPPRAIAQQVILIVNGDIITDYDIDQRLKFMSLSTHKQPARPEVIEDLIDEKLKLQVSRRYKVEVSERDVEASYADMGKRLRLSPEQLTQAFTQAGVDFDDAQVAHSRRHRLAVPRSRQVPIEPANQREDRAG